MEMRAQSQIHSLRKPRSNRLFGLIAAAGLAIGLMSAPVDPALATTSGINGTYLLAPQNLDTAFKVRMLTGASVNGRFERVSGKMVLDERQPSRSRVEVTVDLASIVTDNPAMTDFLKSPAMLDTANNSKAVFVSRRVRKLSDTRAEVDGVLRLKGLERPTKLSVILQKGSTPRKIRFQASGGFFRSLFGMNVGQPLYGDKISLTILGTGNRQ
ncbi:YceI family protein [Roseibium sp. RKSG952]|uniref:YceI family protein n=1 Tax=Roseibium sp. RKSG952 TaxID=2529384 RepID=UPI0012BB7389|nr:YceI family protein [Roseibium sp. RKSG952]MTH99444.1 polyisoprenoid-binding protein [Roseibium sp. RKSG952]